MHVVSSKHLLSLSLALFLLGGTLHAQQTAAANPLAPAPDQAIPAPAPPASQTADLTLSPQADAPISSSADQNQPAPQTDPQPDPQTVPQAPQPQSSAQAPKQTQRILGILPNFRAVSADQKLPPQSVEEKFITASEDSFDYSSLFIPVALAGYSLERNSDPEFGGGGVGYARYLWHSAVDQTSENYFVEFIVPSITREDTRYYTLGHGGFFKRTGYALSRAVITRTDSGNETFNISEVFGAGAAAGVSNLYYPTPERTLSNTGSQWGIDVGIDAASFVLKEFWPDINHALFHAALPSQTIQHQ
jgi:hypothetical protein